MLYSCQCRGSFIHWANGELALFEQTPDGVLCGHEFAKLRGTALIWSSGTWVRKSFCKEHIARKWPDPPPKPKRMTTMKASELRFASDTISDTFWDGKPLMGLVRDLGNGTVDLTSHQNMILDCVELPLRVSAPLDSWESWRGGKLFCLNNRRLWCIKHVSELQGRDLSVKVKIYQFSDCAGFWQSRITTVNGGTRVSIRGADGNSQLPRGDMPDTMHIRRSKRKSEYLHLVVDGFYVDVLASSTRTLRDTELAKVLVQADFGRRNLWAAVCAAAQTQELHYRPQQAVAVKLAKLWTWYVAFPGWDLKLRPRSFLIELIVRHVFLSFGGSLGAWQIFEKFLEFCAQKKMEPIMFGWDSYGHDPRVKWGKGPKVIDPVNPTNNVAKTFRFWAFLRTYARMSLQKIKNSQTSEPQGSKSKSKWNGWESSDEDGTGGAFPTLPTPNKKEVGKVLGKMGLPQAAVEKLLEQGFTSLEALCQLGQEEDFLEAGMNKVHARYLTQALKEGGWIFSKQHSESRLPSNMNTSGAKRASKEDEKEAEEGQTLPPIPLMCYPEQSKFGRCLLSGTLIPTPGGINIAVECLEPRRDLVATPDGRRALQVIGVEVYQSDRTWLVQLEAEGASLTVTHSHRMLCIVEDREVEKDAGDLRAGDVVRCTHGAHSLSRVEHRYERAKVVALTVSPDEAFVAFHPPTASFLCKGQAGHRVLVSEV